MVLEKSDMISENTVFILGAGASKPYGYPTGRELRADIIAHFVPRLEALLRDEGSLESHGGRTLLRDARKFTKTFDESSISSIDKFLVLNPIHVYCGRLAIVISILKSERESGFRESVDQATDWYSFLYERMISDLSSPGSYKRFGNNKVAFITFNYDRSLEVFLFESFINSFSQERIEEYMFHSEKDRRELIPFDFIHVYGQVDKIPWEGGSYYRDGHSCATTEKLSENITLIEDAKPKQYRLIESKISNAQRIFFLGFGYADENLKAIGIPSSAITKGINVYGTAKGLTEKEIGEIKTMLEWKYDNRGVPWTNPVIENTDCYKLLRQYL